MLERQFSNSCASLCGQERRNCHTRLDQINKVNLLSRKDYFRQKSDDLYIFCVSNFGYFVARNSIESPFLVSRVMSDRGPFIRFKNQGVLKLEPTAFALTRAPVVHVLR